ncbi:replication initiation factor domain-containing protein, partial [Staphylococcus aureus]|uniref:replication initiation factor domain-containing protein n=1 Tax=Staphylococcus aureus TaxID=1280 RepID=UPI00227FC578
MEDDGFTRLDLAFDFEDDLSDYYAMTDKSVKKTIFYGRNGKPETKYFGVRDSDRFIRIYNKKQERKDNADIEIISEHLWRVEIELKRDMAPTTVQSKVGFLFNIQNTKHFYIDKG